MPDPTQEAIGRNRFLLQRAGTRRRRIGPLAVDGSTTLPRWRISILPAATSRLAADLVSSIISRHRGSPKKCRAASLGQMVDDAERSARSDRIAASSSLSPAVPPLRQRSEQNFTSSQQSFHFLRHSIRRPHLTQVLESSAMAEQYHQSPDFRTLMNAS